MEISWKWLNLFLGLLFVGLCNGFPINLEDTNAEHTQLLTGLVAVLLTVCSIVFLAGCLCCHRRNGFKEFRNSPVVASTASNLDHGHVNPIANGEFTIFTPLSPPHYNNNVFLASEQVITRTPDDYIYGDINVSSWFDGPDKDFPRIKLKYIRELGKGWFGKVVEGAAQDLNPDRPWTPVVVRILNAASNARQRVLFLNDASIYLAPPHPNLLALMGRCVNASPLLLLQESCAGGDLKAKLRTTGSDDKTLQWCCQLTSALRHLHEHGYVHQDLAARNCLLTDSLTLKIGDYGLSPSKYPEDYYKGGEPLIPVRWRSPESLECTPTTIQPKKLTVEANVWALGVVMWEICENGMQPYNGLDDDEVISRVLGPQGLRLERPSKPELYTDYIFRLIQMCWNNAESRPKVAQIDMMLSDLLQVHKHTQNPVLNATEDFDNRWESLKPNTIVKTDNYTTSIEIEGDKNIIAKPMSPSLNNLHGSLDNLSGSQPMESWLQNVASETKDPTYVKGLLEAIKDLDTTLDLENVSTGSEQSFRPELHLKTNLDFRLGPSSLFTNDKLPDSPNQNDSLTDSMIFKQQGSSESETEEENWRRKVERGAYSEKVRLKSRSVADLMVLTHVDYSESESETPLPSLDYRANKSGRKSNLETASLNFSSEGNLLNIENTFQDELKKLQVERRDSLLFVPDNRSQNDSNLSLLHEFNSPTEIKPVNQIFNVFNVTIDKYSPMGVSGSKLSDIINVDETRSFSRQDSENKSDLGYATLHNSERNSDFGSVDGEHLLEDRNGMIKNEIEERLKNCELFDKSDIDSVKSLKDFEEVQAEESAKEECVIQRVHEAPLILDDGIKTEEIHKYEKEYKESNVFKTEDLNTIDSKNILVENVDSNIVETKQNLPDIIAGLGHEQNQDSVDLLESNSLQISIIHDKKEILPQYEGIEKLKELCAEFINNEIVQANYSTLNQNKDTEILYNTRNEESEITSSSAENKHLPVQIQESPENDNMSVTVPTLSDIIKNNDELMKYIVQKYDMPNSSVEVVEDSELVYKESQTVPDLYSKNVESSDKPNELLKSDIQKTESPAIDIALISNENSDDRTNSTCSATGQVYTENLVSDIKEYFFEGPKMDFLNSKSVNDSVDFQPEKPLNLLEIYKSNLVLESQLKNDSPSEIFEDDYNPQLDDILVNLMDKQANEDSCKVEKELKIPSNCMPLAITSQNATLVLSNEVPETVKNSSILNDKLGDEIHVSFVNNSKQLTLDVDNFLCEERRYSAINYSVNINQNSEQTKVPIKNICLSTISQDIENDNVDLSRSHSDETENLSTQNDTSLNNTNVKDSEYNILLLDQNTSKPLISNKASSTENIKVDCMYETESNILATSTDLTDLNTEQDILESTINSLHDYTGECSTKDLMPPECLNDSVNHISADEASQECTPDKLTPNLTAEQSTRMDPKLKVAFDLSESQEEAMPNSLTHSTVFTSTPFGKKQELSLPSQDTYSSLNLFGAPQGTEYEDMEFSSNFATVETKSPENLNDKLNYSLETWDNFLGKSFDSSRGSNDNLFDSFTSEPRSMLYIENEKQRVVHNGEKGDAAPQEHTFVKESGNDGTFVKSEPKDGTFIKDSTFTKDSTFVKDGTFVLDDEKTEASPADGTFVKDGTFVMDKENSENASKVNQAGGSWESGGGWFLHPQSQNDKLSGDIEVQPSTSTGSYVGFGMDDEIMAAIRNELLEKLPHAQGVSQEKVKDEEEWKETEKNEVFLRYNVYNTPLSPIPEESFEEDIEELNTSGENTPKLDDSDSEWSDNGEPEETRQLSSPTNESPLRLPKHSQSQSSCCSNDTLFNLEDFVSNNEKDSGNVEKDRDDVLKDEVFDVENEEESDEYKSCIDISDDKTLENCNQEEMVDKENNQSLEKEDINENTTDLSKDISDSTLHAEPMDITNESRLESLSKDGSDATLQADQFDTASESKLEESELNQKSVNGFLDNERNHTSSVESLHSFGNKQVAPLPSPEDTPWKSLPASLLTYDTIPHNTLLPANVPESFDNSLNLKDNEITDAKPKEDDTLDYHKEAEIVEVEDVIIPLINIEPYYENTDNSAKDIPTYVNLNKSEDIVNELPLYENTLEETIHDNFLNNAIELDDEQATYQNVEDPSDIINEADYVNLVNLENLENTKHNNTITLDDDQHHEYVNDFKQHDSLIMEGVTGDHDIFGVLTDIRFNGPIDNQLMSTSFSESNDVDEQDWDSGSDTRSSSSGEFIWKEGEHEESLKALRAAPHDAIDDIKPMDEIAEETTDSEVSTSDEEGEAPEFVPSAWDKYATPTKSALRSPEKSLERSEEKKPKGVWFKKQKYHCVYEYPKEPESPILQSQDLWKPQTDYSAFSDWEIDAETYLPPPSGDSDLNPSTFTFKPKINNSRRSLYYLTSLNDDQGEGPSTSGNDNDDFMVSSSSRPFDLNSIICSQFFPGNSNWIENSTPDSGLEDSTPGSISDSSEFPGNYQKTCGQVLPLRKLASEVVKKTKEREVVNKGPTDVLGGLRHTRNKLKLDLPPSPSAFTTSRTFTMEPLPEPVTLREKPTFSTFGKSRFLVQQVDTPTEDSVTHSKNVCFDVLPYKPINIIPLDVKESERKSDDVTYEPLKKNFEEPTEFCNKKENFIKGEASLLDSADEDSGIESSTLERKINNAVHEENLRLG